MNPSCDSSSCSLRNLSMPRVQGLLRAQEAALAGTPDPAGTPEPPEGREGMVEARNDGGSMAGPAATEFCTSCLHWGHPQPLEHLGVSEQHRDGERLRGSTLHMNSAAP